MRKYLTLFQCDTEINSSQLPPCYTNNGEFVPHQLNQLKYARRFEWQKVADKISQKVDRDENSRALGAELK